MFKKSSYHLLSHENSEDILLATNIFEEKNINKATVFFKRINNDLYFCFDKNKNKGAVFCDLSSEFWEKVYKGNAVLVEFGPLHPIEDYEIVL